MQQRLTRSRSEVMIAGVCGGLAEYFRIDPVIVRLIFVLGTVTTGFGVLLYPVLWAIMPKAPLPAAAYGAAPAAREGALLEQDAYAQANVVAREPVRQVYGRPAGAIDDQPPPPEAYRYHPITGEPIGRAPSVGATVSLDPAQLELPQVASQAGGAATAAPPRRRSRISWAGIILLGFGGMLLAEELGLNVDLVFPVLMIALGAFIIFRK
jgi:phage shock protein C